MRGAGPCSGVRVLELGTGAVAPEGARVLAELGADVIKLESRAGGLDFMRTTAGPGRYNQSPGFVSSNRGKRTITVNLKYPRGRAIVRQIAGVCDVVIDNHPGGFVERYGLGFEALQRVRPDLIMVLAPLLGASGPHRAYAGFGPNARAVGGITELWGHPQDAVPGDSATIYPDHIAGQMIAIAVLAALDFRDRTGQGQVIDISQAEVVAYGLAEYFLEYSLNGVVPTRRGNRSLYAAPHGVYPCQGEDRWCAIAVVNDSQWRSFCAATGLGELQRDPRLQTAEGRLRHASYLDQRVAAWTVQRSAETVAEALSQAGVPAAVVANAADLLSDPHFTARRTFVELAQPELGRLLMERPPWRFSALTVPLEQETAPLLGEHSAQICRELLGLNDEEIRQLEEEGVLT